MSRPRDDVEPLVDTLSAFTEGDSISCELSEPVAYDDYEYQTARFKIEDRSNTDMSDMVSVTAVAELNLYGHNLDGSGDGDVESWSLTIQERPDGTATTPKIHGEYYENGGYLFTDSVDVVSVEQLEEGE